MSIDLLIHQLPSSDAESPDPADIFTTSLGTIFPDDAQNIHGDPGSTVIYTSRVFGDIKLQLADPLGEDGRRLFAHYLWNAGILVAELLGEEVRRAERKERDEDQDGGRDGHGVADEDWRRRYREGKLGRYSWAVRERSVVELGAGSGLAGIVAAASGATHVVVTDYPDPQILRPIQVNIAHNYRLRERSQYVSSSTPGSSPTGVSCTGHRWGALDTPFALSHRHAFEVVIAADTLWMATQHENLAASMEHLLAMGEDARVWVVAGFHTGRQKVMAFFEEVDGQGKLEVEDRWEVDTSLRERGWAEERSEGVGERKRWLLVARLRRKR